MPRYIDVDELLRKPPDIHDYYDESGEKDCENGYTIATIKAAPTISHDEVRGVGEWIDYQQDRWVYAKCSECGTVHDVRSTYCPSCGAKMKGAEDGTTE